MGYVVVMPAKQEKKKREPLPPLEETQIMAGVGLIIEVAHRLKEAWARGEDVDDRFRILCSVAAACNDGHKIRVEITKPKEPTVVKDPEK